MVGIPKGRIPPLAFGISTRRTGGAKYDPDDIRFQTLKRFLFRSFSKAAMEPPSTPAAPWFSFTCSQASQTRRLEMSYGFASDIGSSRRRLADFFGWKIGSLRSARGTGPRRCRVGGGALSCLRACLRPPLKLDVQFSRIQLS